MSKLEEVVKSLPPDLQHEVEDFVQFLIQKRTRRGGEASASMGWCA